MSKLTLITHNNIQYLVGAAGTVSERYVRKHGNPIQPGETLLGLEESKAWLQANTVKTNKVNPRHDSYDLKHRVEKDFAAAGESVYVYNGAFIEAAHQLGITIVPQHPESLNVWFCLEYKFDMKPTKRSKSQ